MDWRLPSYKPADCRGDDCHSGWDKDKPCWGQTTVIDEFCTEDYSDCYWIHACEGHVNYYDGGNYIPSHLPEDQGVEPQEI
jgi:hypothetical protein